MITTVVLSLRLRRFRRFSFPCEQDCRDIRPVGGGPPPSADQRVSTGAEIGWHRNQTQFVGVVGVSLLAPCVLRFRRKAAETWDRVSLAVEPCSAYLLSGGRSDRVRAQHSRARSASLFNHVADARCEGAFW